MKAVLFEKYGSPEEVLEIKEVAKPTPKENEVLVKIHATAINDFDWSLVRGRPYLYRLMFGIFKPKHRIPGMELAGVVEELGANVQGLKVGDAVFGALIKALIDLGKICQGQKVLINGGGGGVGTLGLQLAELHDCEVTGVDSNEKLEMMKSIGFDFVLDYKKVDFTKTGEAYDLILDCKTNRSAFSYLRSLKPNGKYVTIGGKLSSLFGVLFWGKILSVYLSKKLQILSLKSNKDLGIICDLFTKSKIECKIDGPHSLEDIPRLIQYFGEGKHKGKVVIKVNAQQDVEVH